MEPTLCDGQFVLVDPRRSAEVGDVVVACDPRQPTLEIVKRVHATDVEGLDLRSDNPDHGTDSRTFGPVPAALVEGVVTLRLDDLRVTS